jgi:hypothetical protein
MALLAALPLSARSRAFAEDLTVGWPETARQLAGELIARYGAPHEVTARRLIWNDMAPWREIVLSREGVPHQLPQPHEDFVTQVVDYRVPADRADDLARFDGSIVVERARGTLAARCDREAMNFLALNLAHEIVTGMRGVAAARDLYARMAKALREGRADAYTRGLNFPVWSGRTSDPDRPAPWGPSEPPVQRPLERES